MNTYSVLVVKAGDIATFRQHIDMDDLVANLPEELAGFQHRIMNAASLGAGHYCLGCMDGGEVHMIVVEYTNYYGLGVKLLISAALGFLIWWFLLHC